MASSSPDNASSFEPGSDLHDEVVLTRSPGAVEAEVGGSRTLLAPQDFSQFDISGPHGEVWDRIDGTRPVAEIVDLSDVVLPEQSGPPRNETLGFLDALMAAGVVRIDD
jgi:hypothetical protein